MLGRTRARKGELFRLNVIPEALADQSLADLPRVPG